MRLGQKIAALHKKNHLFQEALAEKMNVSRQAVSNRCVLLCQKQYHYGQLQHFITNFITNDWEHSWIIWPIAGILYGIIEKIISLCHNDIAAE